MKKVRIGIIGTGGISNKHIDELLKCEEAEIVALCDIDPAALARAREKAGVAEEKCYTDYRTLIADPCVDAVEICTPNYLHAEMARAVLAAGKPLNLEKPISMNYEEALTVCEAERASSTFGMTCFSYRFMPAVRYAKHLVESGLIGNIVGLNVAYLKDSALRKGRPFEWRFDKEKAGSGVIGDLGVHLIDLAQLLAGDITALAATRQIVVKERPTLDGKGIGQVGTEDSCSFLARFASGAEGCFHITRCAMGNINTIRYDVYGECGAVVFDLNNPTVLTVCSMDENSKSKTETLTVPEEFYLMQEQAFVNAILGKKDALFPTIAHGAESQKVVDAILRSAENGTWEVI